MGPGHQLVSTGSKGGFWFVKTPGVFDNVIKKIGKKIGTGTPGRNKKSSFQKIPFMTLA